MDKLYRITPLEKKNVEYFVDVYERLPDGTIRGFDVTEIWRWGFGFRAEDDIPWQREAEGQVFCDANEGWGCELDDLCAVYVNFTDGFTAEEQAEIEARCRGELEDEDGRWGTAWIFDGEHNWQLEDQHLCIRAPVKIDLVDANGYGESAVLEENVAPYEDTEPATAWPFDNTTPENNNE